MARKKSDAELKNPRNPNRKAPPQPKAVEKKLTADSPLEDFEPMFQGYENSLDGLAHITAAFGLQRCTFLSWCRRRPELQARHEEARQSKGHLLAEYVLEVSRTPRPGEVIEMDGDGNVTKITKSDMLGHRKLEAEGARWVAARFNHLYSDRVQQEVTGEVKVSGPAESLAKLLTPEQLAEIRSKLAE